MQHFAALGTYISSLHKGVGSWCHQPYLGLSPEFAGPGPEVWVQGPQKVAGPDLDLTVDSLPSTSPASISTSEGEPWS